LPKKIKIDGPTNGKKGGGTKNVEKKMHGGPKNAQGKCGCIKEREKRPSNRKRATAAAARENFLRSRPPNDPIPKERTRRDIATRRTPRTQKIFFKTPTPNRLIDRIFFSGTDNHILFVLFFVPHKILSSFFFAIAMQNLKRGPN
jgi:hypothetical protein